MCNVRCVTKGKNKVKFVKRIELGPSKVEG